MYLIEPLEESGRYVLHALPQNMNLTMARVYLADFPAFKTEFAAAGLVVDVMGGN